MIWIINALLIWFFTVAFTAKSRLELIKEKEARKEEVKKHKLELYQLLKEKSDVEEEFHNYKLMIGELNAKQG